MSLNFFNNIENTKTIKGVLSLLNHINNILFDLVIFFKLLIIISIVVVGVLILQRTLRLLKE